MREIATFTIIALLVAGLLVFIGTWEHELAHGEIFREAGCDYEIGFTPTAGVTRYSCERAQLSAEDERELMTRQANVEAVGYQLTPIILALYAIFLVLLHLVLTRTSRRNESNDNQNHKERTTA